jgi:hypothetical protein
VEESSRQVEKKVIFEWHSGSIFGKQNKFFNHPKEINSTR